MKKKLSILLTILIMNKKKIKIIYAIEGLISIFIMAQIRDIYNDGQFQKLKQLFYTIERFVYLFL